MISRGGKILSWMRGREIALYGNWCGPGHSGPDDPIDSLDAACKTHDLCYVDNGPTAKCDALLIVHAKRSRQYIDFWPRMFSYILVWFFMLRKDVREELKKL